MKNDVLTGLVGAALLALSAPSQALVIRDIISDNVDATREFHSLEVDFHHFSTAGGRVTFDILAAQHPDFGGGLPNGLWDSYLWLFRDDGALDTGDFIAENDDSGETSGDGSTSGLDSYLAVTLAPGNYVLAVSGFCDCGIFHGDSIIDGLNVEVGNPNPIAFQVNPMSYQLTITGDVHLPQHVSEPGSLSLLAIGLLGLWNRGRSNCVRAIRRAALPR